MAAFQVIQIKKIIHSSHPILFSPSFKVTGGSKIAVPHLPEGSSLEMVKKEGGEVVWQVVKDGNLVREYNEEEIRFTISCKFHLFRSEQEAEQFYSGSGAKLTAESILDGLVGCKPFLKFNQLRGF